ncbi:unnamed protein product [Phaeothamnion confervicola]
MKLIGSSSVVLVAPFLAGCAGFIASPQLPLLSPMWRKGECSNIFTCSHRSGTPRIASAGPSSGLEGGRSDDYIAKLEAAIERVDDELGELRVEEKLIRDGLLRSEGPYAGKDETFVGSQLVAVQQKEESLRREKEILSVKMTHANEVRQRFMKALSWQEWLQARGWWRAAGEDDKQRLLAIMPTGMALPFVDRGMQLDEMKQFLRAGYGPRCKGIWPRMPILYFQASPGVGKTRLLLELCRSCNGSETAAPFYFLPVSFSGLTPIASPEHGIARRFHDPLPLLILRLVFSEACSMASVSWTAFVSTAALSIASGELTFSKNFSSMAIKALLSARGVGDDFPTIVFLVDEITKLELLGADAADEMRRSLCLVADELWASVVFSTLNDTTITNEHMTSYREICLLPLPLLDVNEAAQALETALRNTTIEWRLPEADVDATLLKSLAQWLAAAALGHGRTMEYAVRSFDDEVESQRAGWMAGSAFDIEPVMRTTISRLANLHSAHVRAGNELVQAAILGKRVWGDDVAFSDNGVDVSWSDCLRRGILQGCLPGKSDCAFVPQLSLFSMGAIGKASGLSGGLGSHLDAILRTSGGRGRVCPPAAFETAHARWECMVRLCRSAAGFRNITLAELYLGRHGVGGLAGTSGSRLLHSVRIVADSATPLDCKVYDHLRTLCRPLPGQGTERAMLASNVWQPRDERQPGFDLVMFYQMHATDDDSASEETPKKLLPVAFQLKWSQADSSKTLTSVEVDKAVVSTRRQFAAVGWNEEVDEIPVIFVCWGGVSEPVAAAAPTNCLFLNRTSLEGLYGPSLAPFMSALEKGHRLVAPFRGGEVPAEKDDKSI